MKRNLIQPLTRASLGYAQSERLPTYEEVTAAWAAAEAAPGSPRGTDRFKRELTRLLIRASALRVTDTGGLIASPEDVTDFVEPVLDQIVAAVAQEPLHERPNDLAAQRTWIRDEARRIAIHPLFGEHER